MKNGHIKIEKGIRLLPPLGTGGGRPSEFTAALGKLKIGESFFVKRDPKAVSRHCNMWWHYHQSKVRFAIRTEKNGARVWRVA